MTPQEKLQLNKLLADFDGLEYQEENVNEFTGCLLDFRYNIIDYSEDWNLLMKVVEKIETFEGFEFKMAGSKTSIKLPNTKTISCQTIDRRLSTFMVVVATVKYLKIRSL